MTSNTDGVAGTAGAVEQLADKIATTALCSLVKFPETAGEFRYAMREIAIAAIIEMQSRDDRLTFTERGDLVLHLVWALKPGQPQIVAVCTHVDLAEKYSAAAGQIVPGATGYVEEMIADHAFGRADIQTAIYRAANKKGQP